MWGTLPDHLVGMRGGYVPKVCAVWKGPRRPNNNSIGAFHTVIGSYKVCFIRRCTSRKPCFFAVGARPLSEHVRGRHSGRHVATRPLAPDLHADRPAARSGG